MLGIVSGSQPGSLVNALSPELFAGTAPTRYTRPLADLREAMARLEGGTLVTVYCGGRISAAAVAHALSVTGRDDVAIYDGSLEEWSADAELPLELGST